MRIPGLERFTTADLIEELRQRCVDKDALIAELQAEVKTKAKAKEPARIWP